MPKTKVVLVEVPVDVDISLLEIYSQRHCEMLDVTAKEAVRVGPTERVDVWDRDNSANGHEVNGQPVDLYAVKKDK